MKKLVRITTVPISLDKLLGQQLRYMNAFYEVTILSSQPKKLAEIAKKYGTKYYSVPLTRTISPFRDLWSLWIMYRYLKKLKPEIVHTHTPKAGIIGMCAAFLAKTPVRMHTVAGLPLIEARGMKRFVLNWVEKATSYFATDVYPNSFGLAEFMAQHQLCPEAKIKVLGNGSSNGIDAQHFSPEHFSNNEKQNIRTELGIDEDDFVFVFVGRMVRDKGLQELIEAYTKLNRKKTKLLLIGTFEHRLDPLNKKTIQNIEQNPNIILTGFHQDVRPYFAASHALVFPSYREGFPNVVMQAGAMGLPCIVSDINGCNEIIKNGVNGLIIPAKNATALQDAMDIFLKNPDQLEHMKKHSRSGIVKRFDQKYLWLELQKEYERQRQSHPSAT